MKLTFSYTSEPDISQVRTENIVKFQFVLPEEVKYLIGYDERIMEVVRLVSTLTGAYLHFTCPELNLKRKPIPTQPGENINNLLGTTGATILAFTRQEPYRRSVKQLRFEIYLPKWEMIPEQLRKVNGGNNRERNRYLHGIAALQPENPSEQAYTQIIKALSDHLLVLLNAEPLKPSYTAWQCVGFHPKQFSSKLYSLQGKRHKKYRVEERKREREEAKRKKQGDAYQAPHPKTGKGRGYGAIPGEFMGIQFRSQLEIRMATELQSRGIAWIYEEERLGKGNYLVDFHLPELKKWVEVKGRFEPRDEYLLKEVAQYLEQERGEILYIYTSGKPLMLVDGEFVEITRDELWKALEGTSS